MPNYIFRKFYHTTPPEEVSYQNEDQIAQYISSIYEDVTIRLKSKRAYDMTTRTFDGTKTLTMMLKEVIDDNTRDAACLYLAQKLQFCENEAEQKIIHTGREIQKGLLIFLYAEDAGQHKLIITKADDTAIIENGSGTLRNGVPKKKRVFKSFVVDVTRGANGDYVFDNLYIYDSMTTQSQYWWQDFLLLNESIKDDENTKRALMAMNSRILTFVKKKSPADYNNLKNIIYSQFNTVGEYDNEDFATNVIGNYAPVSDKVDVSDLKKKVQELPKAGKYDAKFQKDVKAARNYKKETIELTDNIDLVLKVPTSLTYSDIKACKKGGVKYLEIRTDKGYDHFNKP